MKSRSTLLNLAFLLPMMLTACGGAAAPNAMMDKSEETVMEDKPKDAMLEPTQATVEDKGDLMETPAWFGVTLSDARTGHTFSINDLQGKRDRLALW